MCGTKYGSVGMLDKPALHYHTLIRSHADKILSMDFHKPRKNIITVSDDKTIRLWDFDKYD